VLLGVNVQINKLPPSCVGGAKEEIHDLEHFLSQRVSYCPVQRVPLSLISDTGKEKFIRAGLGSIEVAASIKKVVNVALFVAMSECGLCQQRPLYCRCRIPRIVRDKRMGVNIISSAGSRSIPLQDAFWSSSCNVWIVRVNMNIRVDLYRRVRVYVMGLLVDPIDHGYTLFPRGADLPEIIRIPYTKGVTLVGYFAWDRAYDDDLRQYYRQNLNILQCPPHVPNFCINLAQVLFSPTLF